MMQGWQATQTEDRKYPLCVKQIVFSNSPDVSELVQCSRKSVGQGLGIVKCYIGQKPF